MKSVVAFSALALLASIAVAKPLSKDAAKALQAAAAKGDGNAIKAGYANLGKTCQACHDSYRTDMHH